MRKFLRIVCGVFFLLTVTAMQTMRVQAAGEEAGDTVSGYTLEDFDASTIQAYLDRLSGEGEPHLSFKELMRRLMSGELEAVFGETAELVFEGLFREIRTNAGLMGQIVILALTGAVFSSFSGIFGSGHVSETGFYVVYLLLMTFLAASFFASVRVADEVAKGLLEFMQALLPAYFLAVTMAGGGLTSAGVCGFTFAAIGLVQTIFTGILMPLMRVYMMLVLAGHLYREDMISKFTEILRQGMLWTVKTLFGVIVGFHVIQGMILPQADALKNASVMRVAQMIPGVGAGAGAVSQLVMGSGILVKNTAGAAAMVILFVLAATPMLKLLLLTALYYMAAAVMQPVCDKRLVSCVSEVAAGNGMLLKLVACSLTLFMMTVAILCISTNAAWYAG
ncbi:MAG: sporulation protein [Lachnospiraceae bacterium]|nr:sporulation protein [Lachnospiraceae bacterium]